MKNEKIVVTVFNNEEDAINGSHSLQDLAVRGDIAMGYSVMLKKDENGEIQILKKTNLEGRETFSGMFIGMFVGIFLGPLGFLLSTLAGTAIGAGLDHYESKFEQGFIDKIKSNLDNGKIAFVANIEESSNVFVDNAMKKVNGEVFRTVAEK